METQQGSQETSTPGIEINEKLSPSSFIKFIRAFLLVLIVIGIGLLCTQKLWVPSLVNFILGSKYEAVSVGQVGVTEPASNKTIEGIVPPSTSNPAGADQDWPCYIRTGNTISYTHETAIAADADSFRTLTPNASISTDCFGKDDTHVFVGSSVIPGADPKTYHLLDEAAYFGEDAKHIYAAGRTLDAVTPNSFSDLGDGYGKTSSTVYYFWPGLSSIDGSQNGDLSSVSGADPATFAVVSGNTAYDAKDVNHYYKQGDVVTKTSTAPIVYKRTVGDAKITLSPVGESQFSVKGLALYKTGPEPGQVNFGTLDATTTLQNGKLHIVDTDDTNDPINPCLIDMMFSQDNKTAIVTNSNCIWGQNVYFDGTYSKQY
jgi:hypothetical protein